MTEKNPPQLSPTGTFNKGDLVVVSNPNDSSLKGRNGEVLTDSKWVVHSHDGSYSAHAVRLPDTDEIRVILGAEMTLSPKNDRHAVGRTVVLPADDGKTVRGVYRSEPRDESAEGILQVVELEESGDFVVEVRPR